MTVTARTVATGSRAAGEGPLLRSPAGGLHAGLGADQVQESGWEIPRSYGDVGAERALITGSLAIADITPRAKIDLRGDVVAVPVGEADLVARISPRWTLVCSQPGPVAERVAAMQSAAGTLAMATDATHLYAAFALCGPRLPDLLARITGWDPEGLAEGQATGAPIVEVRSVLVRRALAVPTIEAYVGSEYGRYVWRSLLRVARSLGGGPVGWEALRTEGWS
jgi:glycine cleavage system aminomethyltransferase T